MFLGVNSVKTKDEFLKFMLKDDRIHILAVYEESHKKEAIVLERLAKSGIIRDSGNFWIGRAY